MTFDGVSFIIVEEIALFADQEGAYTYAGLNAEDTTEEDTEPPTEPDTDPVTEIPTEPAETTTEPAETDPPKKKGCRSTLGTSALLLPLLCAGWLALSKKQD